MMDLVIDRIKDQIMNHARPLTERLRLLEESLRRDFRP